MENVYTKILEQAEEKYGKGRRALIESGKIMSRLAKKDKKLPFSLRGVFEGVVNTDGGLDGVTEPKEISEAIGSSAMPYITDAYFSNITLGVYEDYAATAEFGLVTEGTANSTTSEEIPGMLSHEQLSRRDPQMPYEESDFGDKKVKIYYSDFGKIVSLTWEMIFDDRTNEIVTHTNRLTNRAMQLVAKAIIQTLEGSTRSVFEESSARSFTYDGTAYNSYLYNTTHATVDNQVNNNVATGVDAFSWDNLATMYKKFASIVDSEGEPINIRPNTVVIPSDYSIEAYKLLSAATVAQDAAPSSGTTNVSKAMPNFFANRFSIVESPYLSSSSTWFMGDPKQQMILNWVEKPTTASQGADSESAFSRKIVYRFKVNTHFGVAHNDYRYIVKGTS